MAPRKDYAPEQMEGAIAAVRNGEKVAVAAKQFGVPRITLYNKVTGKSSIGCTMGPSTILTKSEEEILVRWILALCERPFPIPKDNLLDSVQKIITEQNRQNPFVNNRPGKKWFQSFMKRHPQLVEKTPENLSKARDDVTEKDIRNWFQEVGDYLEGKGLNHIVNDPRRIFNTDESAFFLSPKPGRVLAKRGEKHLYSSCGDDKDNLTVLFTGNAAGVLAPPMIVFNYERVPSNIVASVPDGWAIGKSESGWMCSSTFFEYIANIFNPWLEKMNIEKPVLFFLDGHRSHLTLHLSNFCSQNGIEVIALYPNSTHILQPMDLSVFRPLKVAWKKSINKWKLDNMGKNLKKENFAPVLEKAVSQITEDCVKNGFRAGGLHPFGPDYIDLTKIKHRTQIPVDLPDPARQEFIKYLESEIAKNFTVEKLNLFNKLFYEPRSVLETSLPNEDMTLYIIWANNKSKDLNLHSTDALPSTSNTRQQTHSVNAEDNFDTSPSLCRQDHVPLSRLSLSALPEQGSNPAFIPIRDLQITTNSQPSHTITKPTSCAIIDPLNNLLLGERNEVIQPEPKATKDRCIVNIQSKLSQISETTSQMPQEVDDSITSQNTQVNDTVTPIKKNTLPQVLGCKIPTPFKRNLFWPDDNKNKKRRITREKIPSAVTSNAWKSYYEKKDMEKRKQQEEKEERAKQRYEKKMLKEKNCRRKEK